ncbi:Hypothetical predicted protein, partial [Podarcis lilfordi]
FQWVRAAATAFHDSNTTAAYQEDKLRPGGAFTAVQKCCWSARLVPLVRALTLPPHLSWEVTMTLLPEALAVAQSHQ